MKVPVRIDTNMYCFCSGKESREARLKVTTTLYVGNLSFYTNEEQLFELFSRAGEIKRIIMGLDRIRKTPCGFCFVEYFTRSAAENSVKFLSGSKLDNRVIRVDYDTGFEQGRQFGRGRSGGQVRDEYRTEYDPGRGGYGKRTGMTGMQLWGGSEAPNMRRGPRRGRGGRGRGRPRGYAGPMPHWERERGPKRRREMDEHDDYRSKAARLEARLDAPLGGGDRGWRGPSGMNSGGVGVDGDVNANAEAPKMEEDPVPTRNARFERGKSREDELDD